MSRFQNIIGRYRLPVPQIRDDLVGQEKAYSQELQRAGHWPHIWRVVGAYANFSIFDVESNDALHHIISGLPLFPYMDVHVTPLATHPRTSTRLRSTRIERIKELIPRNRNDHLPRAAQKPRTLRNIASRC